MLLCSLPLQVSVLVMSYSLGGAGGRCWLIGRNRVTGCVKVYGAGFSRAEQTMRLKSSEGLAGVCYCELGFLEDQGCSLSKSI